MEINVTEQRFLRNINKLAKPDHFANLDEFEEYLRSRSLAFRFHCKKYGNPVRLMIDLLFKGWQKSPVIEDLNKLLRDIQDAEGLMPYPVIVFPGLLNELFVACPYDSVVLDTIDGSAVVCGKDIIVCILNVFLKSILRWPQT